MSKLRTGLGRVWSQPDPPLMAAGVRGELLVARIRVLLTALLFLIPAVNAILLSNVRESLVGFFLTLSAFGLSALAYFLIRRDFNPGWIGFATSCFDVTLVSVALAVFFLFGEPHTAVNSKV